MSLEGTTDLEKLECLNQKNFKEQAIWILNALFIKEKDADAPNVRQVKKMFVEMEKENGENGCDLDQFGVHQVLERQANQQTFQQLRNHLRSVGVTQFKKIGMASFLIWQLKMDIKDTVNAPQGSNSAELDKAKKMLEEVTQLFEETKVKFDEAKVKKEEAIAGEKKSKEAAGKAKQATETAKKAAEDATRSAEEAQKSANAAAEKQNESIAADNEVQKALDGVNEQENAKTRKMEELEKKIDTGTLVQKNTAKNELEQLQKEDSLPLRKAKITLEATKKKSSKSSVYSNRSKK